jgi:hypothetical protein
MLAGGCSAPNTVLRVPAKSTLSRPRVTSTTLHGGWSMGYHAWRGDGFDAYDARDINVGEG